MSQIEITRYSPTLAAEWNDFVKKSCNGTFLLDRRFMDYHADRFADCSLMCHADGRLVALLPASIADGVVTSHAGLTYGGLIVAPDTTTMQQLECMRAIVEHYRDSGARRIVIKPIPYIYMSQPSEAIAYSFFTLGFTQTACGLSVAVNTRDPLPMRTLRIRGCKRAQKSGLEIKEGSEHLPAYHALLSEVLRSRHNVAPVHTLAEMTLLAERFPENIRLYTVWDGAELLAGVWMFFTDKVAHAQYIAASDDGTKAGALDLLFCRLISETKQDYFDFGICTEDSGRILNEGLLFQKEGFGARAVVYNQWSLDL